MTPRESAHADRLAATLRDGTGVRINTESIGSDRRALARERAVLAAAIRRSGVPCQRSDARGYFIGAVPVRDDR